MPRRVTRHHRQAPLPQRNGIDPVYLILPDPLPEEYASDTIAGFLIKRFYPNSPETIYLRYQREEIKQDDGSPLPLDAPYQPGKGIWYYRELPHEEPLSDDIPVLYEDEHLLAVDKPHFLPTTPRGSYVAQTLLTKLRVRENNPLLIPIHRLDRPTAGILLLAKTREARGPFQTMFQRREPTKTYEAVAAPISGLGVGESLTVRSRIDNQHGAMQVAHTGVELLPGDTGPLPVETKAERRERRRSGASFEGLNAQSRITCLRVFEVGRGVLPEVSEANPALPLPQAGTTLAHYLLEPHTGKTHQLRVHLAAAGAPIVGDVVYPDVLPIAEDEPALPLQLLARSLTFPHPFTGETVTVRSGRRLRLVEQVPATGEVRPLF